jgi:hypothetical protein
VTPLVLIDTSTLEDLAASILRADESMIGAECSSVCLFGKGNLDYRESRLQASHRSSSTFFSFSLQKLRIIILIWDLLSLYPLV